MPHSPLVIILFGLVLVKCKALQVHTESTLSITESSGIVYPELWISDLFYQTFANFTVRNVGSTACQTQGKIYDRYLQNHTNWAVKSKFLLNIFYNRSMEMG